MSDQARVDAALRDLLPDGADEGDIARVVEAMRYAVLGGGKRLRPRLIYAAGRVAGGQAAQLDHAAAAVEMIHAFSLIHDDLPALDDDDLRRGQPTVHKEFGEATAILAGDALLALAFEVVANAPVDAETARSWTRFLAKATGTAGMIGGQMIDIAAAGCNLALEELERMHRLKSGALIHASVMAGAAVGEIPDEERLVLDHFAQEIGLAFQIQDDILDATASTETLGKRQGADIKQGKSTYVSLLGVEGASSEAAARLDGALRRLTPLGQRGDELAALAEQMVRREY